MPLPSPPRRRPLLATVSAAQYTVLTHSTNPPSKRSFSDGHFRAERKRRSLLAVTFFLHCRRSPRPWLPAPTGRRRLDRPSAEKRDEPFFPDQRNRPGCSPSCAAILAGGSANAC